MKLRKIRRFSVALSCLSVVACAPVPNFGPSDVSISQQASNFSQGQASEGSVPQYQLIDIDEQQAKAHGQRPHTAFSSRITKHGSVSHKYKISVGDKLEVTIRELSSDGLFATVEKKAEVISVVVDRSGQIALPFVGEIDATGLSVSNLRNKIANEYAGKAVQPDIQVAIKSSPNQTAVALGDIRSSGPKNLPLQGMNALEFLAASGGTPYPDWEVNVVLKRRSLTETVRLDDIVADNRQNVIIQPRDIVYFTHEPRRFSVFGAVNNSGNIEIENKHASVLKVLAEAGGLSENKAEPKSVFIYRGDTKPLPTVFRLDMRDPAAFFLADEFQLRERDVVYVATAGARELEKFLGLVFFPLRAATQ